MCKFPFITVQYKMARRNVFLVTSFVVIFYFSAILIILHSLYSSKTSLYFNRYSGQLVLQKPNILTVNWCRELTWQNPPSVNVVALVSHPGSGNTWLRYLLQQVTGILTGSIYMDYGLRMHGFPAENVTDGSVLVVKTHEAPPNEPSKFNSAILLIRNPKDALLADFNRLHKGHIGTAPKSAFKKISHGQKISEWAAYVFHQLRAWETLHHLWLNKFQGPVHVVFYETLVRDPKNMLQGILGFLNHTVSKEHINCAVQNQEGIYRRKKKYRNFEPFTAEMSAAVRRVYDRALGAVRDLVRGNCTGRRRVRLGGELADED